MLQKFAFYLLAIMFLLHLALVHMPIIGNDCWRNAQTFSVARNFVEESNSPLQPKYDMREDLEAGYYPGEFPLQTYIIAGFMKVFGTKIYIARLVNLLYSLITALLIYFITKKLFSDIQYAPIISVLLFSTHSLLGFLVTAIMPEMTCFMLSLIAVYAFLHIKQYALRTFTVTIFLCLSTMVKPTGYLTVVFLPFLYAEYQKRNILETLIYFIVPAFVLKLWIGYTMQFEVFPYHNDYAVTHHYARKFSNFITDLNFEMILGAWEKTVVHGFNVAGLFMLLAFIIKRKKILDLYQKLSVWEFIKAHRIILGLISWVLANFAFLMYSGSVQTHQTYYAGAISIPLLFLATRFLSTFPLKIVIVVVFLQLVWKLGYLQLAYFKYINKWETVRLEKYTDQFSTRKDLFLVYNPARPDFTILGKLGRRGINFETREDIVLTRNCFDYIYIEKKNLNPDIEAELAGLQKLEFGEHLFYKLKKNNNHE